MATVSPNVYENGAGEPERVKPVAAKSFVGSTNRVSPGIGDVEEGPYDEDEGDELSAVVDLLNGLTSDDPEIQNSALQFADELIEGDEADPNSKKEGGDTATCTETEVEDYKDEICEETFFRDLSPHEIIERKKSRKERKVKSDIYRQNGNICCFKQEFEEAVRCYTEAIDLIRDSPSLYTNRAFALIKLGQYSKATEDCDRAIFLANASLKARLYKAKALYLNGEHLESVACFDEARKTLPSHTRAIDHCQMMLLVGEVDSNPPRKECDVFPGESFMRFAEHYDLARMSAFFEDSPFRPTEESNTG